MEGKAKLVVSFSMRKKRNKYSSFPRGENAGEKKKNRFPKGKNRSRRGEKKGRDARSGGNLFLGKKRTGPLY